MKITNLKPKEKAILELLSNNPGKVLSFREILEASETNPIKKSAFSEFWKDEKIRKKYGDILRTCINEIRQKTGTKIENVKGIGYKIV